MLLTYKYGLRSSVKVVNLCAYQYHELKLMVEHVLCMSTCKIKAGQHASVYQGINPYWFEGIALISNTGYHLLYKLIFCGLELARKP